MSTFVCAIAQRGRELGRVFGISAAFGIKHRLRAFLEVIQLDPSTLPFHASVAFPPNQPLKSAYHVAEREPSPSCIDIEPHPLIRPARARPGRAT